MPEDLRVNSRLVIPAAELSERFSRSSGPGGQGVNTTDSRVELSFDLARSAVLSEAQRDRALERLRPRLSGGVLTVAAAEHRGQLANRTAARERLAVLLARATAPGSPRRRPTKPSKGAKERRLQGKKQRGQVKRLRRKADPRED